MPVLDPSAWKALFLEGLRRRLPAAMQADLAALCDAVWECAAEVPPDEAAAITSRFIEEQELAWDGPVQPGRSGPWTH